MTDRVLRSIVIGVSIIVVAAVLGGSYTKKYRDSNRIVVTGLGEQEFVSDLIVWRGWLVEQSLSIQSGYEKLDANKGKVRDYIRSMGIADSCVVFMFVNVSRQTEPQYSEGRYVGDRFTGYELRQEFKVESVNVDAVEDVSREISSLIAQGVQMESWPPEYFYTKLSDLKQELIEKATEDARMRAENIAEKSGAKLTALSSGRIGVFQITGANSNEALTAGGVYNSASKNKKASITMRLEYHIK